MTAKSPIDVFLSSTCYDLLDARAELRRHLEANGFLVRLSDDIDSAFAVNPQVDSIQSCLLNVENSDAVVCVIDRRYGPPLPHREHQMRSATHAEVLHAVRLSRPVFFFIRDRALVEHDQLRRPDSSYSPRWVDKGHLAQWVEFVKWVRDLPPADARSNWYDQFTSSLDLKAKVLKRLLDRFPQHVGTLALRPDRLVRLYYVDGTSGNQYTIRGCFRNGGVGLALHVKVGFLMPGDAGDVELGEPITQGGLAEKEDFPRLNQPPKLECSPTEVAAVKKVYCEYENRYGDRYKLEVPVKAVQCMLWPDGKETFFVAQPSDEEASWSPVG